MSKSVKLGWQLDGLNLIITGLERLPVELRDEMSWDIRNTFETLGTVVCAYKLLLAKQLRKAQQVEEKEHQEMLNSPEWQESIKARAELEAQLLDNEAMLRYKGSAYRK
jgi:hypothetical protein